MFNIISWELFLTIILVLVGGYYLISFFAFYRNEIAHWIKSFSNPKSSTPASTEIVPVNTEQSDDMMGQSHPSQQSSSVRYSSISSEELITSGSEEEEQAEETESPSPSSPQVDNKLNLLVGPVADLLEELKIVIQHIAENKLGMTESRVVLTALLIRYPHLRDTSYPLAISCYISIAAKDQFIFQVTPEEAMTWWEFPKGPSQH